MDDGLSVVMPAHNAEAWIVPTSEKVLAAIQQAGIKRFEIIIIDDGSTDDTLALAKTLSLEHKDRFIVIAQKNSGRFIARKRGVDKARFGRILFVDVRTWIDANALVFIREQLRLHPDRLVWNAHINVHKRNNVIARFGDALTFIGWRRYFKHPRLVSYGLKDFDHYPKGTGLFNVPTHIIKEAMKWFESATTDLVNSSDDTLLIRHIAETNRIWLSPQYSGKYFARTTFTGFMKHSYYRGQFFVDGFLRKGTRFRYPLVGFLIASPVVIILLIVFPALVWMALACWLFEFIIGMIIGLGAKDAFSLFILTPAFVIAYGLGIWRAVIRRNIHGNK